MRNTVVNEKSNANFATNDLNDKIMPLSLIGFLMIGNESVSHCRKSLDFPRKTATKTRLEMVFCFQNCSDLL